MTTVDKDFKVKHGLAVANGGTFGGAVTVGTPTDASHAATKAYVDALASDIPVSDTPPSTPSSGDFWFDTLTERLNVYYGTAWLTIATIDDTLNTTDHIHDTSIDGNGLIVTTFRDGQLVNSPQGTPIDGGTPNISATTSIDGGFATNNF